MRHSGDGEDRPVRNHERLRILARMHALLHAYVMGQFFDPSWSDLRLQVSEILDELKARLQK